MNCAESLLLKEAKELAVTVALDFRGGSGCQGNQANLCEARSSPAWGSSDLHPIHISSKITLIKPQPATKTSPPKRHKDSRLIGTVVTDRPRGALTEIMTDSRDPPD